MTPGTFTRDCLLFSAFVLVIILPGLNWLNFERAPESSKPDSHVDFFQYYGGAIVVRYGIWDSLYPVPKPDVYGVPNHFVPRFKTFLFNPAVAHKETAFYPAVNLAKASDCSAKLLFSFPEQVNAFRYIYPPPTALLLWPLSFVSFHVAADLVWPTLSMWALFALAFFSSRIHRIFRLSASYTEGLIVLACTLFAYRGQTHIAAGNVTPILSALLALCVFALMQRRLIAFSLAYIPLILFKGLALTWLPLLLLNRAYWKALIYLALIALILNGITLGLGGTGVYEQYFHLSPIIVIPAGVGIIPGLLYSFGFYPHTLYLILNLTCLGFLYVGFWRKLNQNRTKAAPDHRLDLVSLLAGAMALYCLINFTVFLAYCPSYLFFPFLGWILQEGYQCSGSWRRFILGGTIIAGLIITCDWMLEDAISLLARPENKETYFIMADRPFYIVIIPLFFLIVAMRSLYRTRFPKEVVVP